MKEKIERANVQGVFELSDIQKGILYHYLRNEDNIYNVQLAFDVSGSLDPAEFETALHAVQAGNEALRSVFDWEKTAKPLQIVLKSCPLDYVFHDCMAGEEEPEDVLQRYLLQDRVSRFDLERLALRIRLIRKANREFVLIITHHHILYDGWSTGIFIRELIQAYGGQAFGLLPSMADKPGYGDLLQRFRDGAGSPEAAVYWEKYLSGCEPGNHFTTYAGSATSGDVRQWRLSLPGRPLEVFARQHRVTRAAVVYAAYGILLRKFFNVEDLVFGTVVSAREVSVGGGDKVMGNFINTIPLRLRDTGGESLLQTLIRVNHELIERNPYSGTSYAGIKELLRLRPGEELFDSAVVVENYPMGGLACSAGWQLQLRSVYEKTDIPLLITVYFGEELEIEFSYRPVSTGGLEISALAGYLSTILQTMIGQPEMAVDSLCLLSPEERRMELTAYNRTATDYPAEENILAFFDRQAGKTPEQPALKFGEWMLSYGALKDLSGKIAGYLREWQGVKTGDLVGIMLEREEYLVPCIFGILRAGGSYVPVDPAYPAARINTILEDSGVRVLITRSKFLSSLVRQVEGLVNLDLVVPDFSGMSPMLADAMGGGSNLAYVLYTSGSTGRPKGVMIRHHSVINRLLWMQHQFPIGEGDVLLQKTPITFDVSVWELFWWSFAGATLCLLQPGLEKEPAAVIEAIRRNRVTTIHFVPSMLSAFLTEAEEPGGCDGLQSLRRVFASGEALKADHLRRFGKTVHLRCGAKLINLYGPTEATVDVSWYDCPFDSPTDPIPIGRPIHNIRLYVLDRWRQLLPTGAAGELYIAGAGLARGYLHNEELTAEKFVTDPFRPGEKMYMTGDLVRKRPDGNIVFLDRMDSQVKLRGLRIELGEIESNLCLCNGVREAAVLLQEMSQDKFLVAYYVADSRLEDRHLREFLAGLLPQYMVPAFYVHLPALPLTVNGKLDRKALPDPQLPDTGHYVAPSGPVEQRLAEIWSEVLSVDKSRISADDSFFALGGHSLRATTLVNRIYREFQVRVSINAVFRYSELQALANHILQLTGQGYEPIPKAPAAGHYVLSSAQRRLYFLSMLEQSSVAYNGGPVLILEGEPDRGRMEACFRQLIARHESMRTYFERQEGVPVQKIAEQVEFRIPILEARNPYDREADLIGSVLEEFIRPFDLGRAPLLRAGLLALSERRHVLMVDSHHIIGDGQSQDILLREFAALYNGGRLADLAIQYKDYATWQQGELRQKEIARQRDFWIREFSVMPEALELPVDFRRPAFNTFRLETMHFHISSEVTSRLQAIADTEGTTMFAAVLSIYTILLGRLGNTEDIVVGSPVATRNHPELEKVVGMFVNTLPLRNYPKGALSFREFLRSVRERTLACLDNRAYPYDALVEALDIERDTSRNPLFDTMLAFENVHEPAAELRGLTLQPYGTGHLASHFDIILSVIPENGRLGFRFHYAKELFTWASIERFAAYFKTIIAAVTTDPHIRLSGLEMLAPEERRRMLVEWNSTAAPLPPGLSVVSLFKARVRQAPGNIAVVHGDRRLTYRDLDEKADALAGEIVQRTGTSGKERIGLLFNTSVEMQVSIWAVLKCGFAYIPLSAEAPPERNTYILSDAGVSLLLIQESLFEAGAAGALGIEPDRILPVGDHPAAVQEGLFITQPADPDDLMYIIYTSGTTGRPKGVEITQRNLLNYGLWAEAYHGLTTADVGLQMSPYYFDGYYGIFFRASLSGGALITIPPEENLNPEYIAGLITREKVTYTGILPAFYSELIDRLAAAGGAPDLRFVILAGERAGRGTVEKSLRLLPAVQLENEYGPTEATIGCTHFRGMDQHNTTVIGRPISNTIIYILGRNHELLPFGVKGEIGISGAGVARGYINNSGLTQEKFITDPFVPGNRIYLTGDIGKWRPDGLLELFGRDDDQVKIRGSRVELPEIAGQIAACEGIGEAVVLPRERGGLICLVAWYTSEKKRSAAELKEFLAARLPAYMLPAFYVRLDKLPYTVAGKLDRKALPDPETGSGDRYEAPGTPEEKLLVSIWSAVLGIAQVGVRDNFFAIGGDSIRSIQISSRALAAGYELSVKDLFISQTIKEVAPKLKKASGVSDQGVIRGRVPLTPIQRWFFHSPVRKKHYFNQSVMLSFAGRLKADEVIVLFRKLMEHHDALRTVFRIEAGEIVQEITWPAPSVMPEVHDLTNLELPGAEILAACQNLQSGIDLRNGPLVKLGLFHLKDSSRLLIVIHHLVVDGVSWRILLEDLETMYDQLNTCRPLHLPAKTHAYRDWAVGLGKYADSTVARKACAYWEAFSLSGIGEVLVRDHPGGRNREGDRISESIRLGKEETGLLLKTVHQAFHTNINDILLAALLLAARKRYGCNTIRIDLEGHGREEIGQGMNVSRTVGWFTSIYPVLLEARGNSLREIIRGVKETLRRIPNHGLDYLLWRYPDAADIGPDETGSICFNYLGQSGPETTDEYFSISPGPKGEPAGQDEDALYDWEISGIVWTGCLEMSLRYSNLQYEPEHIRHFMRLFRESLGELIVFCCACSKPQLTPSDLTYPLLPENLLDDLQERLPVADIYPLSPMQEGLLFHSVMDPAGTGYFEQLIVQMSGGPDPILIRKTMDDLTARHPVLRTMILPGGYDRPLQVVLKERRIDVGYRDIREECELRPKEEVLAALLEEDRSRPFDLQNEALVRLLLLRTAESEFELLWSHHHIIMDGWCMGILLRDFREIYAAHAGDRRPALPAAEPYSMYITWLEGREKEQSAAYWRNYLASYEGVAGLPRIEGRGNSPQPYRQASESLALGEGETISMHDFARNAGVSLYTVLQVTWGILLARYNLVTDVVFGSVVSGRPPEIRGIGNMVGLLINTVPVRISFGPEDSIADILQTVQAGALGGQTYHYDSLAEIQGTTPGGQTLLDHILVFENYPMDGEVLGAVKDDNHAELFRITGVRTFERTHYDMVVVLIPGQEFRIRFDYNARIFDQGTIAAALQCWQRIIRQVINRPDIRYPDIRLLPDKEQQMMIYAFNAASLPRDSKETVIDLFDRQAEDSPDKVALRWKDNSMSYGMLRDRADRMAAYLISKKGVKKGDLVGLLLDHEECLVPAILGILKAGAAYVPIDPQCPAERMKAIIDDSHIGILVTRSSCLARRGQAEAIRAMHTHVIPAGIVDLDGEWHAITIEEIQVPKTVTDKDLAYVIFTSGSTGRPKGVMIGHGSLTNYVCWAAGLYANRGEASFALYSSIAFDLTITSIFTPLLSGQEIVIYEQEGEVPSIEKIITDNKVSVLKLTPSHLRLIREIAWPPDFRSRLQTFIVGGEELDTRLAEDIYKKFGGRVELYNEYGPTETTVGCMIHAFDPDGEFPAVPIGLPIDHMQVYVLDRELRPVPFGVTGELYISGQGVARGYLGDEELTRRKFVGNPFVAGASMYRTGDLACRLPDGKLLFKGRMDDQVKIRGFRIEPGEIECQLMITGLVKEVAVLARDGEGEKMLVAYYTAEDHVAGGQLRESLRLRLPAHMIPDHFMQLDKMPLTLNGKSDRKALPSPVIAAGGAYHAPEGDLENLLAGIWSEILQMDKQRIGRDRSFFGLGGHSLKAMRMVNRISRESGIPISLKAAFNHPDIRGLAQYIRQAASGPRIQSANPGRETARYAPVERAPRRTWYPASPAQRRLYFLYEFDRSSLAYNMPFVVRLEGELDQEKLKTTFNRLLERHESLRTAFGMQDDELMQKIEPATEFTVACFDPENADPASIVQGFVRPFDLAKAPLIRAGLARMGVREHLLLVDMHHIISDGISQGLMMEDFARLYAEEGLPASEIQYKDYSEWLRTEVQRERLTAQRRFWLDQFATEAPVLDLPTDFSRAAVRTGEGDSVSCRLSREEADRLRAIAAGEGATLFTVLLTMYTLLLSKLCNQEDIVTGVPSSGRSHADLEKVVGMFVNTLAVRNYPRGELGFREYLSAVRTKVLDCFEHEEWPYEELVNELQPDRDTSRNPLFDTLFVFQEREGAALAMTGLLCTEYRYERKSTGYDLSLIVTASADQIELTFEFATSLFRRETIGLYFDYLRNIISAVAANGNMALADIGLLSGPEKIRILEEFNRTDRLFGDKATVISLFERQAENTPQHIAVRCGPTLFTYRQVRENMDKISAYLRSKGVGSGDLVGLMLRREEYLIPAIFGILKAGAVYVPIDPDYPADRVNTIIRDAALCCVVLRGGPPAGLLPGAAKVIDMNVLYASRDKEKDEYDDVGPQTDWACVGSLAYVIYTSGSTGQPKGVMVDHDALLNIIYCLQERYPVGERDCYLLKTSCSFDVSLAEIFGWFPSGGSLSVLPSGSEGDPAVIIDTIRRDGVTHVNFVPSMFSTFMDGILPEKMQDIGSLKYLLLAGEALSTELAARYHALGLPARLENLYGPTEGTIYSCGFSTSSRGARTGGTLPIGRPLANIRAYIVDRRGDLQPVGVPGELMIAGKGVAKGYLNNPGLTADKFVRSSFITEDRLYKTGDYAKWNEDGNILFLGRIDAQVKIRGFRIEPGEIEYQLARHEKIKEVRVIARQKGGENYLTAYYTATEPLGPETLRRCLSDSLPAYMLPAFFVQLARMPLMPNGKLDRKALPEPEPRGPEGYRPSAGSMEEKLVGIWSGVLGIDERLIGVHTSFFELGGHSLRAAVLVNRIMRELQVEVPLREVFRLQNISRLASFIREAVSKSYLPIPKADEKAAYALSSAQRRLYFLYEFDSSSLAYHLPRVIQLEGSLDRRRLEAAFNRLVARHESLRTSFRMESDGPVQVVGGSVDLEIEFLEAEEIAIPEMLGKLIRPFDLGQAPLMRVVLVGIGPEKHILLTDMHHIISDGISQEVMSRELSALYGGDALPDPGVQYKDYAEWLLGEAQQRMIADQKEFWVRHLDEVSVLDLPADHPRPAIKSYEGNSYEFRLDAEEAEALNRIAGSEGATLFMVLLSVYAIFLARLANKEDLVIGVPAAGRHHPDLDAMIGMFVNTLALRCRPNGDLRYREFLAQLCSETVVAFQNQVYPYESLIEELSLVRDTARNPLFDVMFMFQNFGQASLELDGLSVRPFPVAHPFAKFDLTLIAAEVPDGIFLNFEYSTRLFTHATMERFAGYFRQAVRGVITGMDSLLADIDIIPAAEKHLIIHEFNDTDTTDPSPDTIVSQFERQVQRMPDRPAVVSWGGALTYCELKERADRIALGLSRRYGIGRGERVGLMMDRDGWLIPAILGILKTGAAYVPIDPAYPQERINYLLEDSGLSVVLVSASFYRPESQLGLARTVDVEALYAATGMEDAAGIDAHLLFSDTAYLIYTSGSSGKPKGVMISHDNVTSFVKGVTGRIRFGPHAAMLCLTTISFDIFVLEAIMPLLTGMKVVLAGSGDQKDLSELYKLIRANEVGYLQITPSYLKLMLESGAGADILAGIKILMVGGEAFPTGLLKELKSLYRGRIYNMYGPTETTVWSMIEDLTNSDEVTIGRPIANTRIRMLDNRQKLLPIGVAGELCIGGRGVAKGYWKKEQLTAEKFIPDPVAAGEIIYRTGDLARWLPDGRVAFLGRIDEQVKIRGHRIEPAEIEYHLVQHPAVREAAVIATEIAGDRQLAAYYVPSAELSGTELSGFLSERLPAYMIPAWFMPIEALPLTPNGKLNKRALPDPVAGTARHYVAPASRFEWQLVGIWSEILRTEPDLISVEASFFGMGGHSLNAMIAISRIQREFDVRLSLLSFFRTPTIRSIGQAITVARLSRSGSPTINKITI